MKANYTSKMTIGETGYFMRNNKVEGLPIGSIDIKLTKDHDGDDSRVYTTTTYGFRTYKDGGANSFIGWIHFSERDVFESKESLLASL